MISKIWFVDHLKLKCINLTGNFVMACARGPSDKPIDEASGKEKGPATW